MRTKREKSRSLTPIRTRRGSVRDDSSIGIGACRERIGDAASQSGGKPPHSKAACGRNGKDPPFAKKRER